MKNAYVLVQIIGVVVAAIGAQGAIRIIIDHTNTWLVDWVPGGFPAQLAAYVIAALVGLIVGGWANTREKRAVR